MTEATMWYLCGLGSNICPEQNLPRALDILVQKTGCLRISPVVATRPEGIDSDRGFLNALVVLQSPLSERELKAWFNGVEETLGRDRSDPASSLKDRTIDIDILEARADHPPDGRSVQEPYFRALLADQVAPHDCRTLHLGEWTLGQATATIYWDHRTGHEIVVDQGQRLLDDTLEAAFPRQ
ncbi:2-amino-4-hydroxy-6-hydroxymethyldihydropteridine diphosphokinase [Marinobacter halodurans]|uniref:2-amino-4-hydroxy-6-hydroxymethyldihydropteridine pyrophosphokinase n=1 Tax=Marinobacter halodurans TaxID=2528979 RepID=A0ABY1ZLD0_9GAMM|nr:2-amino-4-hydroxy-6-hydroxymethyldihydropteridine diphosphokinase [Marinobacter halodurans]TBW54880.1 2-amino-4-hydroxy-6-hydroxymethyldihydropteridine diphosphokinase [Marinobacter halodurans]